MKRTKRLLLATCALSSGSLLLACKREEPLPGNPKGSHYDEDSYVPTPDTALAPDAAATVPPPPVLMHMDAGERPILMANPKGSHYDAGLTGAPSGDDARPGKILPRLQPKPAR